MHWFHWVTSSYRANEAHEANMAGSWADAQWYTQLSQMYAAHAWQWWMSARWDHLAHVQWPVGNYAHTDMHHAWMFTGLPSYCKTH